MAQTSASMTTLPKLFLATAIGALRKNMVMPQLIGKNYSSELAQHGDTVNITKRGSLTVENVADDGSDKPTQGPTDTVVALTLDKHKSVSWAATDKAKAVGVENALMRIEDAMIAMAEDFETEFFKLYTDASGSVGTAGTDMSYSTILDARQAMNITGVPKSGRIIAASDKDELALLELDKLVEADKRGDSTALKEGKVGRVAGFDIHCSNFIQTTAGTPATTHNLAFHPNAFALASRALDVPEKGTGVVGEIMVDKQTGLVVRYLKWFDPNTKTHKESIDVLYGLCVVDARLLFEIKS